MTLTEAQTIYETVSLFGFGSAIAMLFCCSYIFYSCKCINNIRIQSKPSECHLLSTIIYRTVNANGTVQHYRSVTIYEIIRESLTHRLLSYTVRCVCM